MPISSLHPNFSSTAREQDFEVFRRNLFSASAAFIIKDMTTLRNTSNKIVLKDPVICYNTYKGVYYIWMKK